MKVLVAVDSFKGSLSSFEAGQSIKEGVLRVFENAQVSVFPVADGGEGTVDALVSLLCGKRQSVLANDPLGRKITCEYGIINEKTAVIEMSCAAGITLIKENERNPLLTTTYGVGEVIKDAVLRGCRDFIIGIGGSSTNDGGVGMLQALGFDILDQNGKQVKFGAQGLKDIKTVSDKNAMPELKECSFSVLCDVKNPLCGENGCSRVFAPQKGATPQMIEDMDVWLDLFADIAKQSFENADKNAEGAGAAGGMGFALMTFMGAKLHRGIDLILEKIELEKHIKNADIVITGEGKLDSQTAMGKVPMGVAALSKRHNKPVIAFAGSIGKDADTLNQKGIDAFFPAVRGVCTLGEAMDRENAYKNLSDSVEQAFRLIKITK